jgi:hypothetical protein
MMFLMPGFNFTPRCTACEMTLCDTLTIAFPIPGSLRKCSTASVRNFSYCDFAG